MKKLFLQFVVIFILLLTLVGFFSATESQLECKGQYEKHDDSVEVSLLMRLTSYRWWVLLWNESDGILRVNTAGSSAEMFYYLKEQEGQIQISREIGKPISGQYAPQNGQIKLLTQGRNFSGLCKVIESR